LAVMRTTLNTCSLVYAREVMARLLV
jgi:hypothetical protein